MYYESVLFEGVWDEENSKTATKMGLKGYVVRAGK